MNNELEIFTNQLLIKLTKFRKFSIQCNYCKFHEIYSFIKNIEKNIHKNLKENYQKF